MQIRRLKIRGAKGISRGLGREEAEIDFTRFENGLIALVGPNGAGKSTILENLHPYRRLASREGSLQGHFELRDSMREVEFKCGSDIYLSKIFIDAQTSKSEAYLYKNGEPLNNGLTGTYDTELTKILPDEKLFFVSAFTAQRAKGFADLKPADRKQLLINLLNFSRYQIYHDYAKDRKTELQATLTAKDDLVKIAGAEIATLSEILAREKENAGLLQTRRDARDELNNKMDLTRTSITQLKEESARLQEKAKQVTESKIQSGARITELQNLINAKEKEVEQNERSRESLNEQIVTWEEITENIPSYERMLVELAEAEEEIRKLEAKQKEVAEIKNKNLAARNEHNGLIMKWMERKEQFMGESVQTITGLRSNIRATQAAIDAAKERLKKITESASLIDSVPCSRNAEYVNACSLLGIARKDKESFPALQKEIEGAMEQLRGQKESLVLAESQEHAFLEFHAADKPKEPTYEKGEEFDVKGYATYRAKRDEIKRLNPQEKINQAREGEKNVAVLEEKTKALLEATANIATQIAQMTIDQDAEETKYVELTNDPSVARQKEVLFAILRAEGEVKKQSEELTAIDEKISSLEKEIAVLESKKESIKAAEERIKGITLELSGIRKDLSEWEMVRMACGKDGIPALELDAAGPAITAIANTLLSETFGSDFQIAFETTRETKKEKKLVESFEIMVYDNQGMETKLENLSGGERVWVEKALAEAITIHLNESSGIILQTGYSDEADGALDPDRKQVYLDMLRAAHRRAGRYHTLVISHTEAIWSQISQRISLHPETGEIEISC